MVVGNHDVSLADLLAKTGAWIAAIQAALVETEEAGARAVAAGP